LRRNTTIGELRWPETPEFVAVASQVKQNAVAIIIDALWSGYDLLVAEVLARIDVNQADAEVERSITQLLEPRIREHLSSYLPFYVQHSVRENESRRPPPAQAPEYDVAFVLRENPRVCWPVEAKVLRTDRTLAAYLADIREQFLTCRYAPFSASGAMVGYLLKGDPHRALGNIEAALAMPLINGPNSSPRPHKVSAHVRLVPEGKPYPALFECHHLMMNMGVSVS
jgi:hypothetical protein